MIQCTLFFQFSFITYLHFRKFCTLSIFQQLALFSHFVSLLLSFVPPIVTLSAESYGPYSSNSLLSPTTYHSLQIISSTIFLLFVLTLLLVLYLESISFSLSRAYHSPLPLSRSASGWIPLQARRQFHLLLGTISILNYTLQSHHHPDLISLWFDPFSALWSPSKSWSICCSSNKEFESRDERREFKEGERDPQSTEPRSCGSCLTCGLDSHHLKLFSEEASSFRPRSKSGGRSYGSVLDNPTRCSAQSPPYISMSHHQTSRRSLGNYEAIPVRKHSGELEGNEDDDF